MKHRDAYTLEGGKNMQQTSLGRVVRCLAAVLVLVTSLALLACPGDEEEFRNVDATIPVNSTGAGATQATPFTFANGSAFGAAVGANPATLTFNTASTFTLTRTGGATATGTVAFASCTLTVTGGTLLPVSPAAGSTLIFPTCNFRVLATGVEVDGASTTGTLTLILINAAGVRSESAAIINVQVAILADGTLVINNVNTGVDTDVTGTTGTSGG